MGGDGVVLLDTCVVIDLERLDSDLGDVVPMVGSVTVAELAYGLATDDLVARYERTERYHRVLAEIDVLPFGVAEAKVYGILAALVRRTGRDPRPRRMDLQIAATASAAGIPLLTRNSDDFVGLERMLEVVAV